jgi:hypothetical protein
MTIFAINKTTTKLKDKYHAVKITLCESESRNCLQRECQNCGTENLVTFFTPLLEQHDGLVSYTKWGKVKKRCKGKEDSQIMPIVKKLTATAVALELMSELEKLAEHLFVAKWQQTQFSRLVMPQSHCPDLAPRFAPTWKSALIGAQSG